MQARLQSLVQGGASLRRSTSSAQADRPPSYTAVGGPGTAVTEPPAYENLPRGEQEQRAEVIMADIRNLGSSHRSNLHANFRLNQLFTELKQLLGETHHDEDLESRRHQREYILKNLIDHIPVSSPEHLRDKVMRIYQRALHPQALAPGSTHLQVLVAHTAGDLGVNAPRMVSDEALLSILRKLLSSPLQEQRGSFIDMASHHASRLRFENADTHLHMLRRLASHINEIPAWQRSDGVSFMRLLQEELESILMGRHEREPQATPNADVLYSLVLKVLKRLHSTTDLWERGNEFIAALGGNLGQLRRQESWTHVNLLAALATFNSSRHGHLHHALAVQINNELTWLTQQVMDSALRDTSSGGALIDHAIWLVDQLQANNSSCATAVKEGEGSAFPELDYTTRPLRRIR